MCLRFVVRFIITALLPHCESKASYSRFVHDRFVECFNIVDCMLFAIALLCYRLLRIAVI